jgi:hypothetical protein
MVDVRQTRLISDDQCEGLWSKGDGSTVDQASVECALARAMGLGESLHFPAGVYVLTMPLKVFPQNGRSLVITAEGKDITRLKWIDNGGIKADFSTNVTGAANKISTFSISDISLTTVHAGGTAIELAWPPLPAWPYKNTRIHNVEICGDDYGAESQSAWSQGIAVTNPGGLDISHADIHELPGSSASQAGITRRTSDGANSIRHFLSNLYVNFYETGIEWIGHNEGIYFSNFEIVGCGVGFRVTPGQSGSGGLALHMSNGPMDCRTTCVPLNGVGEAKLNNLQLTHSENGGQKAPGNLVQLTNCVHSIVTNCSFAGYERPNPTVAHQNGITIGTRPLTGGAGLSSGVVIIGNQFLNILDAGVVYW